MLSSQVAEKLFSRGVDLAIPRMTTEYDLICSMLADFENTRCCRNRRRRDNPRELVVTAIDAGIMAESFYNEDLRLIFDALDGLSVGSHTRLSEAAYVTAALRAGNWWDDGQKDCRFGWLYTPETFGKMLSRYPYAPAIVGHLARKLAKLLKEQQEFEHRLSHLLGQS